MSENHRLSVGSVDGFVPAADSADDMYSLYTGLSFRRRFLPFKLGKRCCNASGSSLKNVLRAVLTNGAVSVIVIVVVLSLSVGLGLYALLGVEPRPVVDYSLKAFSIPNHEVTRHQEAFDVAKEDCKKHCVTGRRARRSVSYVHREKRYALAATQYHHQQKVILVYDSIGDADGNIFTRERIETIHRVETDIVTMPGFSDLCYKGYPGYSKEMNGVQPCNALNSLVSRSALVDLFHSDYLVTGLMFSAG